MGIVGVVTRLFLQSLIYIFSIINNGVHFVLGAQAADDLASSDIHYNDTRVASSTVVILTYIEGAFGALVLLLCGFGAILAASYGYFKKRRSALNIALGLALISIFVWILRHLLQKYFNTEYIEGL